jgi:hypothetical protein
MSEGALGADRILDPERCRRIGWIRAVIENCRDPLVECWREQRGGKVDHLLWFREEYVTARHCRIRSEESGAVAKKANAAPEGDGI